MARDSDRTAYDMPARPLSAQDRYRGVKAEAAKAFRNCVVKAAYRRDPRSKQRYLEIAAEALVRKACEGDNVALAMLADRIDGKVSGGDSDNHARVSFVVHMPAPLNADQWQRMANTIEHAPQATQLPVQRDLYRETSDTSQGDESATEQDMANHGAMGETGQEQRSESQSAGQGQVSGEGQAIGNNITLGTSQPVTDTHEARASDDVTLGDTDSNVYPLTR
jgi:hypothetical protein